MARGLTIMDTTNTGALADTMLRALNAAVTEAMHQPDLPDLVWSVDAISPENGALHLEEMLGQVRLLGQAGGQYDEVEVPAVLSRWANHLGLARDDSAHESTLEYRGIRQNHPIVIWGVVDRFQWELGTEGA